MQKIVIIIRKSQTLYSTQHRVLREINSRGHTRLRTCLQNFDRISAMIVPVSLYISLKVLYKKKIAHIRTSLYILDLQCLHTLPTKSLLSKTIAKVRESRLTSCGVPQLRATIHSHTDLYMTNRLPKKNSQCLCIISFLSSSIKIVALPTSI
jgi:hypothetical protein